MLKRTLTWLCFLTVLSLSQVGIANIPLPLNQNSIPANLFTSSEEAKLGREFWRMIRGNLSLVDDVIVDDYINALGKKLTTNAPHAAGRKFHFFVVADPEINAFAGPGGYVGANSGLILATNSEDELAAVLAHETAHVTEQHVLKTLAAAKNVSIAEAAAIIAAVAIGSQSGSDSTGNAAAGTAMAAMAGGVQKMINFTRSNERDADRLGMETLYKSGFDPLAMPLFFERLQRLTMDYGGLNTPPPFLQTHPVTSERILDAKRRAEQYGKRASKSSATYAIIKARIKVLTTKTPYDAIAYFKPLLDDPKTADAARYGYALALDNNYEFQRAEDNLQILIKKNPTELLYKIALAEVKMDEKKPQDALAIYQPLYQTHPNYYPLMIEYGDCLIANKQYEPAEKLFRSYLNNHDDDTISYIYLAEAFSGRGQLADAYLARARAFALEHEWQRAILQLEQAKKLPHLSENMRAILDAKIKEFKSNYIQERKE